jgi:hypothetical protein
MRLTGRFLSLSGGDGMRLKWLSMTTRGRKGGTGVESGGQWSDRVICFLKEGRTK